MRVRFALVVALLGSALVLGLCIAATASAAFGLSEFDVRAANADETAATLAGSHPFAYTTEFGFNTTIKGTKEVTEEQVRDIVLHLPPGFVGDPLAVPTCSNADFLGKIQGNETTLRFTTCPDDTVIGFAHLVAGYDGPGTFFTPVYNLDPRPGEVARFGLVSLGEQTISIDVTVSEQRPYHVIATVSNIPQIAYVFGSKVTLWGNPGDPAHDWLRGKCVGPFGIPPSSGNPSSGECPVAGLSKPFLTLPGTCTEPLPTTIATRPWLQPDDWLSAVSLTHDSSVPPQPVALHGCEELQFSPTIAVAPTNAATQAPTGLAFDLDVQDEGLTDLEGRAAAEVKRAEVTLPEGFTTNPSLAEGLAACSPGDLARETATSPPGRGCPLASKIGSLQVETPVLSDPVEGSLYVASPFENEAGNGLLGLYMVIKSAKYGILIKQPLQVLPDPRTGRLTAIADDLPQLPFSHFKLHFREGPRSPLTTPEACGQYAATAMLTPWSGTAPITTDSLFTVSTGPGGGACPSGQLPFAPTLEAGSTSPAAGAYSPFVLKLQRNAGSQRFSSLDATLPPGLLGRLAGVSECTDAQIAAAASRSAPLQGAVERGSSSCPPSSEVGIVRVGAGSGSPTFVAGHAYLAGPYKGAPLSLAVITPAISGPFDLGTVVVRVALEVDRTTAQVSALSDPFPTIIAGIPLDIRSVLIEMNRPQFTLNPTNCEPMAVSGQATSTSGAVARLDERFQVGDCRELKFKPSLSLRLKGPTRRAGHPALTAVLTYPSRGKYANIARAQVGLPAAEFLDQGSLSQVCTQGQLNSRTCPRTSIYGHATAWSPLLDKPLEGPVYLGVGYGHKLPDLVADLDGQIRVLLHARIDTTKKHGLRSTFEVVPDAPISRFVLKMRGGKKKGLLENSENICQRTQRANARFVAQNNRVATLRPRLQLDCPKLPGSRKHHPPHHRRQHQHPRR